MTRPATLILLCASAGFVFAQDAEKDTKTFDDAASTSEERATPAGAKKLEDLTGKERRQLEDQIVAEAATEYNKDIEKELDKVVCKRVTVTGSRKKERVCRTVRDIEAEKAASKRMLRRRDRAGTGPAQTQGSGVP